MYANHDPLRILTLGLDEEESHFLNELILPPGGKIYSVDTDLDLWNLARTTSFDLVLLGQSVEIPFPTMRVWLIRGLLPNTRIAVLYDSISSFETAPLADCEAVDTVQRPAVFQDFHSLIAKIRQNSAIETMETSKDDLTEPPKNRITMESLFE